MSSCTWRFRYGNAWTGVFLSIYFFLLLLGWTMCDKQGGTMGYNLYIIPRSHLVYFGASRLGGIIARQPGGRVEEPLHSEKTSFVAHFVR